MAAAGQRLPVEQADGALKKTRLNRLAVAQETVAGALQPPICPIRALAPTSSIGSAKAGRVRWKIENGNCNTLANHGYKLQHNCGHGKQGLANLLAFVLHKVMDGVSGRQRQGRVFARGGLAKAACRPRTGLPKPA